MSIICALLLSYQVVLIGRAVLSWFPQTPGTAWNRLFMLLVDLTEPLLGPLRRVIPPMGMFDLSFLVLFFIIAAISSAVCGL